MKNRLCSECQRTINESTDFQQWAGELEGAAARLELDK